MNHDAVSSVVGSILLVGITVVLVGGLALLVFNIQGPSDEIKVDLQATVTQGTDGSWATGDEVVRITHRSGEAVPRDAVTIRVTVDGSLSLYSGSGLTGGFTDGRLSLGETWSVTKTILAQSEVRVDIILEDQETSRLLISGTIRSGSDCTNDVLPPSVISWDQSPEDVTTLTTGAVTVTAGFRDLCGAVDTTVAPTLYYRLNDGSDPTWTDGGAMSFQGSDSWSGTIPDQTWLLHLGQTLQYYVVGVTDTIGNSGDTSVQGDIIQLVGSGEVYTDAYTTNTGSVTNFADAQMAGDGLNAELQEAGASGAGDYHATTTDSDGVTNPGNAFGTADDVWATDLDSNNEYLLVDDFDTSAGTGPISEVLFRIEAHYDGVRINDDIDLEADLGAGWQILSDTFLPDPLADNTFTIDITGLKAGWTWTDIQDLRFRAIYDKQGGTDSMDVSIDTMYVTVTTGSPTYAMDIELGFPTPSIGILQVLELRYAVVGDTFHVDVLEDGLTGTWNTRGGTLDGVSLGQWMYTLTPLEAIADGGSPLIRIVDDTPGGTAQGTIQLDYARVVSA